MKTCVFLHATMYMYGSMHSITFMKLTELYQCSENESLLIAAWIPQCDLEMAVNSNSVFRGLEEDVQPL